jgi:hypothetical protein
MFLPKTVADANIRQTVGEGIDADQMLSPGAWKALSGVSFSDLIWINVITPMYVSVRSPGPIDDGQTAVRPLSSERTVQ